MHCHRPKVLPAIVHPTKCCEEHSVEKYVVPHVHPTHTTHYKHNIYEHLHYYPHTDSFVEDSSYQNFNCGQGGPGGPGMMGPGMSPYPRW